MIQENVSLRSFNTFGVEAQTRFFAAVTSVADLASILKWYARQKDCPLLVLGGGSNVLFTQDWPGLTLKISIQGKKIIDPSATPVLVEAGAGEDWHEFVLWTLDQGLNGLENLSLIPGNVGASPLQNIGAYGVEIKDCFWSMEAINIQTGQLKTFSNEACEFGYRDSIFKGPEKGNWIIVAVTFALKKDGRVHTDYGTIQTVLKAHKIKNPTPKQVSQAVTAIRQTKLPDPKLLGSAGSFFKNPMVSHTQLQQLQQLLPDVPNFKVANNKFKIPAGFLIEQLGWKGKSYGHYGVHEHQALVLVNYGGATGSEIWDLAQAILSSVKKNYGIDLETEVNVI